MKFTYHLMPKPFVGNHLLPLNNMPKDGELYKQHAAKYVGREQLMEEMIPLLNCKWNDVVQFSGINPRILIDKLMSIYPKHKITRTHYLKIPINKILDAYPVVVFYRQTKRIEKSYKIFENEVSWLKNETYEELSEVPKLNIDFWTDPAQNKGTLLLFPYVPHILVKGEIDIGKFEVCEL